MNIHVCSRTSPAGPGFAARERLRSRPPTPADLRRAATIMAWKIGSREVVLAEFNE